MLGVRQLTGWNRVWVSLAFLVAICTPVHAQNTDTVAPVIELEELSEGVADRTQVFTVLVAEDNTLKDVTLYHRRNGQLPYTPTLMTALGSTGYFSASIPTDPTDLRTIEYYVQARDDAGNRTVSGFAFDPYIRTLAPSPEQLATPATDSPGTNTSASDAGASQPFLKRRWVQVTLGVIAVGALASLASDDGEDTQVVPLNFTLQ